MDRAPKPSAIAVNLRRRAETRMRERQGPSRSRAGASDSAADRERLLHELQVHQIELEVQNAELQQARNQTEALLKKSEQHYGQLLEESRHMEAELRLLSRRFLSAQEEERKKISRELHDVIAQTLTGINMRLATLKKAATSNTRDLEQDIARTQRLVEDSVNTVHRFARELRPTALDDLGLIPALHAFMKSFTEQTGIRVSLSAFAAVEQLSEDKRTVLYRVSQEALTNIARHAHASRAEVAISRLDGAVCLKIADDGKGFQTKLLSRVRRGKRLGLLGMRERLEMVGGDFSITSVSGAGTTVLGHIPLDDRAPTPLEAPAPTFARTKR